MRWLDDIKIGKKLMSGFSIVALLLVAMAVVSFRSTGTMKGLADSIYKERTVPIGQLGDASQALYAVRGDIFKFILMPEERASAEKLLLADEADLEKQYHSYLTTNMGKDEKAIADKFDASWQGYKKGVTEIVSMVKQGRREQAIAELGANGEVAKLRKECDSILAQLSDLNTSEASKLAEQAGATYRATVKTNLGVTLLAVGLAIALGLVLSRSITGPLQKGLVMMQAMSLGDLRSRLRMDRKDEIGELAKAMDTFSDDLKGVVSTLQKISAGDLSTQVATKGAEDEISPALKLATENIRALVVDAQMLSKSAVEGKLSTRADASKHQGDYRKIVEGVNACLDSVIGPLNVAASYVDKISKGDIPPQIAESYNGDFNVLKNNLNTCIAAVDRLVTDATLLSKSAVEGKLSTRADASKHQGDFRKIVEGVNQTLDAVISPMNEAVEVMQQVARRDLTVRVEGQYQGDLSKMKDAINIAVGNLDEGLQQVSSTTVQVATAAEQISSGSQGLSQGASEQASSLEEISSSLEEMSSMTKQNAENAKQAKALSESARQSADRGNEAMGRMQKAIVEIKTSSDQTAKILKTIDEIAFQTNLLALNAAVEAARAGEAGKGFAVVAEEVRNLAQRSAEAARNTANMIESSVKSAEGGVRITEEVAKALAEIVEGATKVNDLVGEIAAASQEQRQGIDQVNVGVTQLNTLTQSNAASAEESASASEELSAQAQSMEALVSSFKISSEKAERRIKPKEHKDGSHSRAEAAADLHLKEKLGKLADTPVLAKSSGTARGGARPEQIIPLSHEEIRAM